MTEDFDLDLEWARDLFDKTRGAGEPGWSADPAVLARAGDRRRRFRTTGVGGGFAGVLALTTALAVGLGAGAGTADLGAQAGPGGAWGNRPLSDVFKYVHYLDSLGGPDDAYVPAPAASDLATVLGNLDPSLTHLVGSSDGAKDPRIVAAGDSHAKQPGLISMSTVWTTNNLRQSGELTFGFASNSGWGQLVGVGVDGIGSGRLAPLCAIPIGNVTPAPGSPASSPTQWSECSVKHLQDGSTMGSASARVGAGAVTVVVRLFADGEVFSLVAENFGTPTLQGTPDPATVLQPTPWTEDSLVAALADPAVQSGWDPIPSPTTSGKLLQPADLGKGWSFDVGQADQGVTGEYLYPNDCSAEQGAPLARPGIDAYYWGPLPNGVSGTAYEGEYVLKSGTGAQTMAKARANAQGGCKLKNDPVDYSKDTLIPLPAGIGDDAFAESIPSLGMVSINVRIGDTILRTDLTNSNHVRDETWTDKKPLDLTSPSDQQWLASIARSMVSRYPGGATHH